MPQGVASAIRAAAAQSGVDPHLLTALAWRESRFDPKARNRWSSATGLLQFTSENLAPRGPGVRRPALSDGLRVPDQERR